MPKASGNPKRVRQPPFRLASAREAIRAFGLLAACLNRAGTPLFDRVFQERCRAENRVGKFPIGQRQEEPHDKLKVDRKEGRHCSEVPLILRG